MDEEYPIQSIGYDVKVIHHLIQREMIKSAVEMGVDRVTVMHGWIIGYLARNRERDVYQRDIEAKFGISRSTVTNILQCMEKNGYIKRESVPSDARLKKLTLTEKGEATDVILQKAIAQNEERFNSLLSEDERDEFLKLTHKLRAGLEMISKGECND
ncbi:MAG: MarR family winged helix-turn-helix transcriptional regulator [Ruminococcus sp.]|nr:MarR family winged helix-turn-helix transcriptional regulator [Ruminococcus sp.]